MAPNFRCKKHSFDISAISSFHMIKNNVFLMDKKQSPFPILIFRGFLWHILLLNLHHLPTVSCCPPVLCIYDHGGRQPDYYSVIAKLPLNPYFLYVLIFFRGCLNIIFVVQAIFFLSEHKAHI
jgi:hypothetical protein